MASHTRIRRPLGPGRFNPDPPTTQDIIPLAIPRTLPVSGAEAAAGAPGTPIRDALRRAAIGFAAGVAATPQQAGQAPGLGAAVGALSGLGQVFERERERRSKREERLLEPARAGMLETARQEAQEPFRTERSELRQRQRLEALKREFELIREPALTERERAARAREAEQRARRKKSFAERVRELRELRGQSQRPVGEPQEARILTPDGRKLVIPRSKLPDAIRLGATEIE